MLRTGLLTVASAVLAVTLAGCGVEEEHGIAKSPYAPTQAQLEEFNKQVSQKYTKVAGKHVARKAHH
ncbi:hypothetical protein [Paludisphaera mucosa]|uniref:Secreted protein n=1 Tax=Paludisphaera mucosa TaxID=3030827 RepID=A0ABT6FHN0_9BACT|nr:hypothetical protein [Paludisphaera mucosa]MDG3006895.1 hypothetical protein [Paludisphaera mucosa]